MRFSQQQSDIHAAKATVRMVRMAREIVME
jgi:hypothetical protein